ncbi:MAG TPA: trehalose-6-phosphate synthase [Kineosporiaceae bacterium]|nr:trehalose-6-phosphate synthase [Kineosporiaceae bacterium]
MAGQPPPAGDAVPDCGTGPLPLLEDLDDTGSLPVAALAGGGTRPDPATGAFDLVIVANRLPVDRRVGPDGTHSWQPSPGGLVAALEPVMRRQGGAWVGWTGSAGEAPPEFDIDGMHLVPIGMEAEEVKRFYEGMSNGTLWPLYHDVIVAPTFHRAWWESYVRINRRFADAAAAQVAPGGTVWVQDYQLQLVPRMMRRMRPDLKIGFFNHIPFPPYEIFSQLPWRRQVLKGLLGADLLGFQRPADANNFLRACRRIGLPTAAGTVRVDGPPQPSRTTFSPGGRTVRAAAFPISIDSQMFEELAHRPDIQERARQIRHELGDPDLVLLGVDRLDYTKGILHRLQAFGELLDEGRLTVPGAVLVQVATPSRERVGQYQHMREQVEVTVGRINGTHGQIGHPAVHYLHQSVNREELVALYLAADVMLVTSLRDGMNLVAKEYVASRIDERGALVLSEFTGAAIELKQAYVVNPHDIDGLKAAVVVASSAGSREATRRMRQLRRRVFDFDVSRWATDFLRALERSRGTALEDLACQPDLLDIARLEVSRAEQGDGRVPAVVDLGPDDPDLASLEEDDLAPAEALAAFGADLLPLNAGRRGEPGRLGTDLDRDDLDPERLDPELATLLDSPHFADLSREELERLQHAELDGAGRGRPRDRDRGLTSGRPS